MRTCVTILCVVASLAPMGLTDEVSIKGFTYRGVTIIDVKEGTVTFKMSSGPNQSKAFSDITAMSITGLDNFNEAEKLMSEVAGDSAAKKLRKEIEARKKNIDTIKAQVADQPKEIARLQDEAKRTRMQRDAYKKSAEQLAIQIADLKKSDASAQSKVARLKEEMIKLAREANAIKKAKKKDWQNQANQRLNQAKALKKQIDELDATKLKYQAKVKRAAAAKLLREAKIIERGKKKDWQKQANNRKNQAKNLNKEAADFENKAKHVSGASGKGRAQIVKLTGEMVKLKRQSAIADRKAAALDNRAKAFPKLVKDLKEKLVELEVEFGEMNEKLEKLATEPRIKPGQFAAAIRAYEAAAALKTTAQVKTIINFRLLNALNRAGWIDQAASKWLQLADRERTSLGVIACRPNTLADKGDPRNAKAISRLGSRVSGISDKKYRAAALELLVRLLQHEGRGNEIIKYLPKTSDGEPKLELLKAIALLDKKEYTQAETVINDVLRELDRGSLSEALAVRAKALYGQADAAADKKKKQRLMQEAGLDFMRVATFFRGSRQAGESLYLAGKIMASLPERPNTAAAANAYKAVVRDYAGTPIGQKASIALKTLRVKR